MENTQEPREVKKKVKPALKKHPVHSADGAADKRPKKGLKWDEKAITEHDQLRGTRMKIDEPNTPFTHYDSHSDHDSDGERRPRSPVSQQGTGLNWDHLNNKLSGVAAARDAYPSSPSSHGGDSDAEEERRRRQRHLEFQKHRAQHYNEFQLMKKLRDQHPDMLDLDGDRTSSNGDAKENNANEADGDGDDEMET